MSLSKELLAKKMAENSRKHALANQESEFDAGSQYTMVSLDKIEPNPYQPRTAFKQESLDDLASSISESGLLQPILLRKNGDKYQIIAGERRYRSHKILGKHSIPAVIQHTSDADMAISALSENLNREDLTDFEISKALKLIDKLFPSKTKLAESLGINRQDMYRYYAFDDLPNFAISSLERNPHLLSRSAANEIKRILSLYSQDAKVLEIFEQSWDLLEKQQLEQTKIPDFIQKRYGETKKEQTNSSNAAPVIPLLDGNKAVGSISNKGKDLIVKIKKTAFTDEQTNRLKVFLENLMMEDVPSPSQQ